MDMEKLNITITNEKGEEILKRESSVVIIYTDKDLQLLCKRRSKDTVFHCKEATEKIGTMLSHLYHEHCERTGEDISFSEFKLNGLIEYYEGKPEYSFELAAATKLKGKLFSDDEATIRIIEEDSHEKI